jgi:uncharacterized protein (DUF2252 family)
MTKIPAQTHTADRDPIAQTWAGEAPLRSSRARDATEGAVEAEETYVKKMLRELRQEGKKLVVGEPGSDERKRYIARAVLLQLAERILKNPIDAERKLELLQHSIQEYDRGMALPFMARVAARHRGREAGPIVWDGVDRHLGNYGDVAGHDGEQYFGCTDFDEVARLPVLWATLRTLTSIWGDGQALRFSQEQTADCMAEYLHAYFRELGKIVEDPSRKDKRITKGEGPVAKLLEESRDAAEHPKKWRAKLVDPDTHRFRTDRDDLLSLTDRVPAFQKAINAYQARLGRGAGSKRDFEVLDVAEKFGSGVGSEGERRYFAYLKSGKILEIKEQIASCVSGLSPQKGRLMPAQRWFQGKQALLPSVHPLDGWLELGGRSFSVIERLPSKGAVEIGDLNLEDFQSYVRQCAKVDARLNARTDRGMKAQTAQAILRWAGDDQDAFVKKLVGFGEVEGKETRSDHALYVELRRAGEFTPQGMRIGK